jgi:hypothetical protein
MVGNDFPHVLVRPTYVHGLGFNGDRLTIIYSLSSKNSIRSIEPKICSS